MFVPMRRSLMFFAALGLAAVVGRPAAGDAPPSGDDLKSWVGQRVKAWEPTADERRFDQIGWVTGIREAERLAREHGRPVFLFTHDGHMAVGRC